MFDQRPGELEATRGLAPRMIEPVAVLQRFDGPDGGGGGEWRVALIHELLDLAGISIAFAPEDVPQLTAGMVDLALVGLMAGGEGDRGA